MHNVILISIHYYSQLNPGALEFIPRGRLPQTVDGTYDKTGNTSLTPKNAITCDIIENDKATTANSTSKQNNNKSCKKEVIFIFYLNCAIPKDKVMSFVLAIRRHY